MRGVPVPSQSQTSTAGLGTRSNDHGKLPKFNTLYTIEHNQHSSHLNVTQILTALAIPLDLEMPHTYVSINYAANYQNVQNGTWFTQPFNRFNQKNKRELSSDSPVTSNPISRSSFYKTVIRELDK